MAGSIGAGFDRIFWWYTNDNNEFWGSSSTGPTAGTSLMLGPTRLLGARSLPATANDIEVVSPTGDNAPTVTFQFASDTLPSGTFEVVQTNDEFEAAVTGQTVQTRASARYISRTRTPFNNVSIGMLLLRKRKSWEESSKGAQGWEGWILPAVTVTPLGNDITEREFTAPQYSFTLDTADRYAWGETLIQGTQGFTGAADFRFDNEYPQLLASAVGDNSETDFTLPVAPVDGTADNLEVYVDGTQQTLTSDYTVSGSTIQFNSAPADGALIVAVYNVLDSNLP